MQTVRKYHGYEYTKSTTTGSIGIVPNSTTDEEQEIEYQKADQNSMIAIDERIVLLKDAIANY